MTQRMRIIRDMIILTAVIIAVMVFVQSNAIFI